MPLSLTLPPLDSRPVNPPETRPSVVAPWLSDALKREPIYAARVIGDALAATNRVAMSDGKRLELAELYFGAASMVWPPLERAFVRAAHPLSGQSLDAAKVALTLAQELSNAYKRLLAREADKRIALGGQRLMVALIHRALQCTARILVNSYQSYAPVPAHTWSDAHAIYHYARGKELHLAQIPGDPTETTPDRIYIQSLLLALANPYGFYPGQIDIVVRYLNDYAHWAKLTDVPPVHRMAKAVAIVPVGHDFPPFSANKGGSVNGTRFYLLTFDLAFQLQEQLRALDAGGEVPQGIGRDPASRQQYVGLLKRLLRQWAIPPARQFSRLPSRGKVVMCAGLTGVWQHSDGLHANGTGVTVDKAQMATCQILNHTPGGYALRQLGPAPMALRIGELIALQVEGRTGLQVAMIRWFRNTLTGRALEFGCELLSESPEAAAAAAEDAPEGALASVVVLPADDAPGNDAQPPSLIVPAGTFAVEEAVDLRREHETGYAVLTKLVDHGPGFEIYEFVPVG